MGLALAAGVLLTACGSSPCPSAAGTNSGSVVLAPLVGQAATNQARFLEYIRNLPKNAAYEARHFTSLSKGKEQMRYLLLKPKNFQPTQSYPLVPGGGGSRDPVDAVVGGCFNPRSGVAITQDQNLRARPAGGPCSIGAVEF